MENEHSESVKPVAKPSMLEESPPSAEISENGSTLQPAIVVPPLIKEAQDAFFRDLPQLLKERRALWVAYRGNCLIGFAPRDLELYQECCRRGIPEDEFLVLCIEEEASEVVFCPYEVG